MDPNISINETINSWEFFDYSSVPFIVFDQSLTPIYLNCSAAQLLQIQHRTKLDLYLITLQPIIAFIKTALHNVKVSTAISNIFPETPFSNEIILQTSSDQKIKVVAFARSFNSSDCKGWLVRLHNLAYLEPFFALINHNIQLRTLLINKLSSSESAAKNLNSKGIDFLPLFTSVLDLIDQFIEPGIEISSNLSTSVLLDVAEQYLRQHLINLLLKSAEFVSPSGQLKINTTIVDAKEIENDKIIDFAQGKYLQAEIIAKKNFLQPLVTTSIESYIFSRCFPKFQKVFQGAEVDQQIPYNLKVDKTNPGILYTKIWFKLMSPNKL